jgi:hypothetical protein
MKSTRVLIAIFGWICLVALACNLAGDASKPPTLVPRKTEPPTPQPTLGYATQVPGAVNQGTAVAQQAQIEVELFNVLNEVESDRLMLHIDTLVGFHTRHVNSSQTSPDQGIGAAYRYIVDQLLAIQARSPNFTVFPDGQSFEMTFNNITTIQHNAIAQITGTDEGAGVIVIGAHYDSRADDLNDAAGFAPAASDNGTGVAALLELARILSTRQQRATIMFVFFSGEEENRQGSRAFVQNYIKYYNIPVIAMINLDTIGSWNDSSGNIDDIDLRVYSGGPNDSRSRQLARMTNFLGYNLSLNLNLIVEDAIDREGRYGDHFSFQEAGYPSVRFIEALEDHYNREGRDTIDKVEPAYLVKSTRTVLGVVLALAGGPRPPRNIAFRDMGNGMSSLVWEPVNGATQYIVALRRGADSLIYDQQFTVIDPTSGEWDRWRQYEAVAVAAVDSNGLVGPLSSEFKIPR